MKPFCKYCKYYINKSKAFDFGKRDYLRHICAASLIEITNALGYKEYQKYGDMVTCEECGTVLEDPRELRYQFCYRKNKNLKCKDFKPKWQYKLMFWIANKFRSKGKNK